MIIKKVILNRQKDKPIHLFAMLFYLYLHTIHKCLFSLIISKRLQLDTTPDENKPQIGPLLMDIRQQRHLVLASMLGLDPDLPLEHVSSTAKEMFAQNLVAVDLKRKILEAFSDLHMKAVRRLVIAGGLRPRDLSLGCQIEPVASSIFFN